MKKILFAGLLLFTATILNAYTRGDIITEIRNELSDTNTDPSIRIFSDTLLHSRIDQAEEEINKLTRCMVSRSTISTTCGTSEYEFPESVLRINRVTYDTDGSSLTTKYTELIYNTMDGLDNKYDGWEYTSSGTPSQYYYRGPYLGLYPAPDLKHSGTYGDIRIDYFVRPTTSTDSTSKIFNGYNHLQTYKNTIIDYICALCARDEGEETMMNFFWNKFNADVTNMIERINNIPDRRGGITR